MKLLIHNLASKTRRVLWHCLWVIPICLLLIGSPAIAVPVTWGDPCPINDEHIIDELINQSITGENITSSGVSGDVVWTFTSVESTCILGPDNRSFTCPGNTITVQLPGNPPAPGTVDDPATLFVDESSAYIASAGEEVMVTGSSPDPTNIDFTLRLLPVTSTNSGCTREFEIKIQRPVDIGFVLDRSGSMNRDADPANPGTTDRWTALKAGVQAFANILAGTDPDTFLPPSGSQYGLTLFSEDVTSLSTLVPITSSLSSDIASVLDDPAQNPGGWTSIGDGLEDSISQLSQLTDPTRGRGIILFSDGEQNRPRFVTKDGLGFSEDEDDTLSAEDTPIPDGIKIATVGVGAPSGEYLTTLHLLAENHGSHTIITPNGGQFFEFDPGSNPDPSDDVYSLIADIQTAFTYAGIDLLASESPLLVTAYTGTLSSEPVKLPEFDINQKLKLLLINLSFGRDFNRSQLQSLLDGIRIYKNDTDVTEYFQPQFVGSSTNSAVLKTNFTVQLDSTTFDQIASEGSYRIEWTKPSNMKDFAYQVTPIADDSRLHVEWGVEPTLSRVFESVKPKVNLSWRGKPLKDMIVYATLEIPGQDLGDVLARNPKIITPDQDTQDSGSPGYQKYLDLLKNDPEFVKQLAFNGKRLQLTDPDGDGSYETSFTLGDISGEYQIIYQIRGKDPESASPIQRLLLQSVYTRFGDIDMDASSTNTTVDGSTTIIDWRPMTTYGRFIGPDQGKGFTVNGDGIELSNVIDNQDGSYRLVLSGDPKAQISVKVLGEEVYQGQADQFGPRSNWPLWLIILIIVLIILLLLGLLLWFLRRGESASTSDSESESESDSESSSES